MSYTCSFSLTSLNSIFRWPYHSRLNHRFNSTTGIDKDRHIVMIGLYLIAGSV